MQINIGGAARGAVLGRAALKMGLGTAVWIAGFVLFVSAAKLGIEPLRPILPIVLVAGVVLFGMGVHEVLWAPPRDTSTLPRFVRAIISGAVAIAFSSSLSFIAGIVVRSLRST
jgi:hypothetical protein